VTPAAWAITVVVIAVVIDLIFGDPPNRWHPVAWLGGAIGVGTKRLMRGSPWRLVLFGTALTLGIVILAGVVAWAWARLALSLGIAGLVLEAVALKSLMALRSLVTAARMAADDLMRGDLPAARTSVGIHLVSRATVGLDTDHVASAAIESVAENLTDAFVAPLCFYLVFGLPGAAIYRAANTADSMIGYRQDCLEYFGKCAARLDDALNFVPARFAGFAIAVGAALVRERAQSAFCVMMHAARRTASPNAGWTMAAMAGALGINLEKVGAYSLGNGPLPSAPDIGRSIRVMLAAAAFALGVGLVLRLIAP
jgi:adenosylcobinamide-phosphate synthase